MNNINLNNLSFEQLTSLKNQVNSLWDDQYKDCIEEVKMTKAYQVFSGDTNKHGFQEYDLQATYFDKDKALEHCKRIVESEQFKNEHIEETEYGKGYGTCNSWDSRGWDIVTICKLEEIEIV